MASCLLSKYNTNVCLIWLNIGIITMYMIIYFTKFNSNAIEIERETFNIVNKLYIFADENECNINVNNTIEFGSFDTIPLFYFKKGYSIKKNKNAILSVATMCHINRLSKTKQIISSFAGPISIAIFIEETSKLDIICNTIKTYFDNINNKYDIYIGIIYQNLNLLHNNNNNNNNNNNTVGRNI
eukprot:355731_1